MEAGRHSITALHAAFMRAHHAAHARPTIFADTYAHLMLSASERKSIETRLLEDLHRLDPTLAEASPDRQTALAVAMRALPSPAHIIVRARYAEDALAEAIPHGLRSYVIIGAGMDTFALRHLELHGRLQVVELDHPATQAFKRQRVAEVGLQTSPHLRFVPVDLEREDLAAVLARLAFEPGVPVFCSWLGVAAYLSQTAILDTLQAISRATPAGSHLVFDQIRPGVLADRAQFFTDLSAPFYGANRPGAQVSPGLRNAFWLQGMLAGVTGVMDCIKAFSETDFTEDLKTFDVPIGASALVSSTIIKNATLKVYPSAPHGLTNTHKDQLNTDLLAFLKA